MKPTVAFALGFWLVLATPGWWSTAAAKNDTPEEIQEFFYNEGAGQFRCLTTLCEKPGSDDAQIDACYKTHCGIQDEWKLTPTRVRYDGKKLTVQVQLDYKFENHAKSKKIGPRKAPIWLGLSAKTSKGKVIDVPAKKITMNKLSGKLQIGAEVGPKLSSWLVAAWHMKISPCKVDRPGCKQHGYVLEGKLAWHPRCAYACNAVWPSGFTQGGGWEPVPPGKGKVSVRVLDAGGGADWVAKAIPVAKKTLGEELSLYGRKLNVQSKGKAKNPRDCLQVLYKNAANKRRAEVLAKRILSDAEYVIQEDMFGDYAKHKVTHWPKAPADYVVALGAKCAESMP
jgi:hypothetical protein